METKRQISYYRSQIRAGIAEAIEQDDERAGQWSIAYEDIAVQIRTNINLENLNKLLEAHKALQTKIYEGLTRYNAVKETKETTCSDAQKDAAYASLTAFQPSLTAAGYGAITTEILPAGPFFYAEAYHQQYLAKNPGGYCGLGGTGVSCPIGLMTS